MKNILFILGVTLLLFSCKKDQFEGNSIFTGCPGMYDYRSEPLDLSIYDSIKWYYDTGCSWGMEPLSSDSVYNNVTVNPNNPYEIAYVEWIPQNSGSGYSLYTYNFCTNTKTPIYNGAIYGENSVDWSAKNKIYILRGTAIKKMNADGSNVTKLFNKSSPRKIKCNPDGTLFSVSYSNYPAKDSVKIYTEEGAEIFTLPEPNTFLGWYDDAHVLTSLDGQTIKTNVLTGGQEFFLSGEYYSYDYKTERFLKSQDSVAFRKWIVIDKNGGIVNEMPYHYSVGSFKGVYLNPVFGLDNKLIVNLTSNEFYPDKHTPSCGLKTEYNIIIMDMDGTNVRKVNFPE